MAKVICPKCGGESYFSLLQATYKGPYRCTSCRETFNVIIENDEVKSATLLNQTEVDRMLIHNPYKKDEKPGISHLRKPPQQ